MTFTENLIGLAFEMTSLQNHESQQKSCFKPLHSGVACYGPQIINIQAPDTNSPWA